MKKYLRLFFLIMFVIGTDTFLVSPLLPTLREEFSVSIDISGWLVGAYALGYALFALLAGPLSDGWDRKKVMLYGMLAFALSTFMCGFADGFWSMFLFRFLAGISAAFVSPQVWASITSLVPPAKIVKAMGIATAGLSISQMLGVPIGSWLAVTNWSIPFFVIGVASLILVVLIQTILPNLPASTVQRRPSIIGRYRTLFGESKAKKAFLAYFVFQLGNFTAFSFIGTLFADHYGLSIGEIGTAMIVLGFGNAIGSFAGGSIVQKIGQSQAMKYGIGILILLYAVLSYSPMFTYVEAAFFGVFLLGGLLFPIMMGSLQTLSTSARGTIASFASSSMYAAATIGSSLAGILYVNLGGFLSIGVFSAICFATSLLLFTGSGVLSPKSSPSSQAV